MQPDGSVQNPSRRDGHDSPDWIDRIAADIRDLNPDYHDFEAEVARMIRVAVESATSLNAEAPKIEGSPAVGAHNSSSRSSSSLRTLVEQFDALRNLQQGWDSYGAGPIDPATIDRAQSFFSRVNIVPCVDGGVQLEWHTHGLDLEIAFTPNGELAALLSPVEGRAPCTAPPTETKEKDALTRTGEASEEESKRW